MTKAKKKDIDYILNYISILDYLKKEKKEFTKHLSEIGYKNYNNIKDKVSIIGLEKLLND